jgi:amidophosphoribosyltransferase
MACFDGDYPIPLPEEARLGKHLLELTVPDSPLDVEIEAGVADTVSGAASGDPGPLRSEPADRASALLTVGYGAEDALRRP